MTFCQPSSGIKGMLTCWSFWTRPGERGKMLKTSKQLQDLQLLEEQLLLTKLLLEQTQVEPKVQLLKGRMSAAGYAIPLNMQSSLGCALVAIK